MLPLAREGTPIVRDRLRPLARAAPARLNTLGAAAGDLATAAPGPDHVARQGQPAAQHGRLQPGRRGVAGGKTFDQQRNRQEGYLYWAGWAAQTGGSLFGAADGQGVFRRFTGGSVNCGDPDRPGPAGRVTDLLGNAGLCSP